MGDNKAVFNNTGVAACDRMRLRCIFLGLTTHHADARTNNKLSTAIGALSFSA